MLTEEQFQAIRSEIEQLLQYAETFYQEISGYGWSEGFSTELATIRKKWKEQRFQVAVMALTKAGKSTLINACLGDEYLPSGTVPETMRLVRIRHSVESTEAVLNDGGNLLKGTSEIRKYLHNLNKKARDIDLSPNEEELILEASLVALSDKPLGEQGFDIIDAPGVNEVGVDALAPKIERLLKDIDVIIYLLDYMKLKTADEEKMFTNLSRLRGDLVKDLSKRMFFVVNKIDTSNRHDREHNLGKQEVAEYVVKLLNEQVKGLHITTEQVLLVSAEKAILSRLVISGRATAEQLEDFKNYAFGNERDDEPTENDCRLKAVGSFQKSGVEKLEDKILSFIYEERSHILLSSVVNDLDRLLIQTYNNLRVSRGALLANKKTINKLKTEIHNIRKNYDQISKDNKNFKIQAEKLIENNFNLFKQDIDNEIIEIFEGIEGSTTEGILPRQLTDFFRTTSFKIESTNKDDVIKQVKTFNKNIFQYLNNRFNTYWNKWLSDFYVIYENFSNKLLIEKIQPLVKQIETKIEQNLHISLRASTVTLPMPNLDSFYNRIQQDISSFVKQEQVFNLKFTTLEINYEGFYIFGWQIIPPIKEIPWISLTENIYVASTVQYKEYIKEQISPIVEYSRKIAISVIDNQFQTVLTQAGHTLENYSNQYIKIIEDEVNQINQGSDIQQRILKIEEDIESVDKFIENLNRCRDICN